MKEILVKNQAELDKIRVVNSDEILIIKSELELILNFKIEIFGTLINQTKLFCNYLQDKILKCQRNSTIENSGNATVINFGNATVRNFGNATVRNFGNATATIENCDNATATIENCSNATVTIENSGNVIVRNCDNATATIENSGNATVRNFGNATAIILKNISKLIFNLKDFSIGALSFGVKAEIKKSKTATLIKQKELNYFQKYNLKIKNGFCILYKRVSKDFKTQENTNNETIWKIGKTITHKNWNPTESECGEGKFHACATPYFCNEFRDNESDKYIAIKVKITDTYEWKNGNCPTKIAFREGKVLYECDVNGKKIIKTEVK